VRKFLADNPRELDPRKGLTASTNATTDLCKTPYETFGAASNAAEIRLLAFDAMAHRHERELDPSAH
jgi:fructose-bisphosphate aldolase, class II